MKYILFIHSFIHIIGKYIAMEAKVKKQLNLIGRLGRHHRTVTAELGFHEWVGFSSVTEWVGAGTLG